MKKRRYDKFTIRGFIYATIGLAGISYEVFFRDSSELIVIILYIGIIGIGIISIFRLREYNEHHT